MSLLLILLHLGISAALSLNQAYEDMKGDVIESCKYGRFCVDGSPDSFEIMEELECESGSILDLHAGPSNVEFMQDCSCDCEFPVDYYCRLCVECSYTAPTIAEILVRTMPDIPIDLADTLAQIRTGTPDLSKGRITTVAIYSIPWE
ncbi:hypothetical protein ACTXT7_004528 [Hymenolepis weldensis]